MFRDRLSVLSSRLLDAFKVGPIGYPETSVSSYQLMRGNVLKESKLHYSGSLNSQITA